MPIRPENKKLYPKDWKQIAAKVKFERAESRCECRGDCGTDHTSEPGNPVYGLPPNYRCTARHGAEHPITGSIVVLTVMHLDHNPTNNEQCNLMAGCQRCHNLYDMPMRRKGSQERARAKRAIGELL